ncbi:MAG: zinc ribbon domain-containing protein [Acidobacteriota bacterium]
MNADLEALIRLQETNDHIRTLTTRIETEIPRHIAELESELRGVRDRVEAGEAAIQEAQRERARLELDLKSAEEKVNKYKVALMQVKTNDEYRAALNEIDYTNRIRSDLESRVLELMEAVENRLQEMEGLKEELRTEDAKIHADRKVLEDERDGLVKDRAGKQEEANHIQKSLPDHILRTYSRIAAVRGGVALTQAINSLCGSCNMRLRPSVFQQVKRNDQVMTCDSCGRIIYYRDPPAKEEGDAGGRTPTAVAGATAVSATTQGE